MKPFGGGWPCLMILMLLTGSPLRRAGAQLGCSGATCTVEISMPVVDVLRLSVGTSSVSLGSPTDADYTAGYHDVPGAAVTVSARANRPFIVDVSGLTGAFTYSGSLANPLKPASDLRWAKNAAALASTTNDLGQTLALINRGAGAVAVPLFLRALWDFTRDVPGTYSLAIRLTLSAP